MERVFVREYVRCRRGVDAYLRAGYKGKTRKDAGTAASIMLRRPNVRKAVADGLRALEARLELSAENVLREIKGVAFADARELFSYEFGACRYCHGDGHKYQYTPAEWERRQGDHLERVAAAELRKAPAPPMPDPAGGVGFDPRRPPHEECPECFGEGQGRAKLRDLRDVSPSAAALFAGIKEGKHGIEIKTHPKLQALELLGRHLALFKDQLQINPGDDLWQAVQAARKEAGARKTKETP